MVRIYKGLKHLECVTVSQVNSKMVPMVPIFCIQAFYIPLLLTMDRTCDLLPTKRPHITKVQDIISMIMIHRIVTSILLSYSTLFWLRCSEFSHWEGTFGQETESTLRSTARQKLWTSFQPPKRKSAKRAWKQNLPHLSLQMILPTLVDTFIEAS